MWLAAVTALPLLVAGCSGGTASHDPVFESTQVREATGPDCPGSVLCVTVTATVVGSRQGEGSCELYGPGDPDELTPLAATGDRSITPGEDLEWTVELPGAIDLRQLNVVCRPMIEG